MNCDQVFVILTRGPFPTGEPWDEEVEAHLEKCGDCWQLANALRPALEVFQEAVPPAESRDLPGYWGAARPASQMVTDLAGNTRTATAGSRPKRQAPTWLSAARQASNTSPADDRYPLTIRVSPELLRAIVLAATVTATCVAVGLVWWL